MTHRSLIALLAFALSMPGCARLPPAPDSASATPNTRAAVAPASAAGGEYFEQIESTATAEDAQRLVCRREAPPGTRVKQTVCRTRAQMGLDERKARRTLGGVSRAPVVNLNRLAQ